MPERTATCRACGRPIQFVRTPRGKLLPVDPEPVLVVRRGPGTVTVVTPSGEVIRGYRTDEPPDPEIGAHPGRVPHWVTCWVTCSDPEDSDPQGVS